MKTGQNSSFSLSSESGVKVLHFTLLSLHDFPAVWHKPTLNRKKKITLPFMCTVEKKKPQNIHLVKRGWLNRCMWEMLDVCAIHKLSCYKCIQAGMCTCTWCHLTHYKVFPTVFPHTPHAHSTQKLRMEIHFFLIKKILCTELECEKYI